MFRCCLDLVKFILFIVNFAAFVSIFHSIHVPLFTSLKNINSALFIIILEDDPRSTPGHSKVLDQITAIIKLMIGVSTVGLTKKSCIDVHTMAQPYQGVW